MKARVVENAIVIHAAHLIEGVTVLETTCASFKDFCALPGVVEFEGRVCGKTGWSSDTNLACYKSDAKIAFAK